MEAVIVIVEFYWEENKDLAFLNPHTDTKEIPTPKGSIKQENTPICPRTISIIEKPFAISTDN